MADPVDNSAFLNWHASLSPDQKTAFANHVQSVIGQPPQQPNADGMIQYGKTPSAPAYGSLIPTQPGRRFITDPGSQTEQPTYQAPIKAPYQPAPPPQPSNAQPNPDADAAFLAFQRSLSANEDTMRADIAKKVAAAQQSVQDQLPSLQEHLRRQKLNIQMQHAGAGTWSSSGRLNDENQASQDTNAQVEGLNNYAAGQVANYNGTLSNSLAADQRQLAEERLNAYNRSAAAQAQADAARRTAYNNSEGDRYRNWMQQRLALSQMANKV